MVNVAALSKIQILSYNFSKDRIPSQKFLLSLVENILSVLGEKKKIDVAFIFVSSKQIQQINKRWRNKNKTTTVISFPSSGIFKQFDRGTKTGRDLGEIFICPAEIKKVANQQKIPIENLYSRLLVHSILHLYGFTHGKKNDSQKMQLQEHKIFQLLKI
ncbi:MAG: Endoribonuclease YbeY [Parcubacteria group bacterium ADurb.Bin305]|nr:rRNA maturation RNase YbeY [Candidatus Paceibacterota bacterium]OQA44057.1 MAG: Endoribonuclease YbeY [Parcubacteria group bacterium ADurb.Bin305]